MNEGDPLVRMRSADALEKITRRHPEYLALLSMKAFSARAGQPVDATLAVIWVVLALAGLAMSCWFFRHCRARAGR